VHEFALKLAGATYMDIHKMGGGIGFTVCVCHQIISSYPFYLAPFQVGHTKQSSIEELSKLFESRLNRMIKQGTTVVEAKSGYGLETDTEMKMLKVIHQVGLKSKQKIDVVGTYLAHSIPKGSTAAAATEDIVTKQIPALIDLKTKGEISPEFIDVFCETGVFEIEDTRRILEAGIKAGLEINFHGDELHPVKAAELAGELNALAVSHLELVSDEGIIAMAKRPSYAILLPTTAYILKLKPPPARKLIEKGMFFC
jgi:imidazolonepropionase